MSIINAAWAQLPIQLTEELGHPVWRSAGVMTIPEGFLLVKNDAQFLYAALDIITDTGNDPGDGDYFWFAFDRNRDGNITPNFDALYSTYPGRSNKLARSWFLGPNTFTGINQVNDNCKVSFEVSPNSSTPHRVWKMKISLTDLNVSLAPFWWPPFTKFGIKTHSGTPAQDNITPANLTSDFSALHILWESRVEMVIE